jgi:hypothetical protein
MTEILKVLAPEQAANTANSYSNNSVIRLVNVGTGPALINVNTSNSNYVNTSFTMLGNSTVVIQKWTTDTLIANNNSVFAAPVAYKN